MSWDKPDWVYIEDGRRIYHASVMGACVRSLTAAVLGELPTPPGEKLRAAMDKSSDAEDRAIELYVAGRTRDCEVIWRQKTAELPVPATNAVPVEGGFVRSVSNDGTVTPLVGSLIRGHIDGLDRHKDVLLEVKCFGADLFKSYDSGGLDNLGPLGVKYRWQAAVYGHGLQRDIRFVVMNKVTEELIVEPPVTAESLVPLADIYNRVEKVEEYAAADDYPPCDRACTKWDFYAHIHEFASDHHFADADAEALFAEYKSIDALLKELTDRKTELADAIKGQFVSGKHTAGRYKATIIDVPNPTRFDTRAHKKIYPECHDQFIVPSTPYKRLTVDVLGERGDTDATDSAVSQ